WMAAPVEWRVQAMLLLPVVTIVGIHTVVFGHSRYHLPVIPILALYASSFALERPRPSWVPYYRVMAATATGVVLTTFWLREVLVTNVDRLRDLLTHVL